MSLSTFLPEWAAAHAILISWPHKNSDWAQSLVAVERTYQDILTNFTRREDVVVLLHPSIDQYAWFSSKGLSQVNWEKVFVVNTIPYDDTWIRDYGPLSLTTGYLNVKFNGWGGKYPSNSDNSVNEKLFALMSGALQTVDLTLEGGALEVNGAGDLIVNAECVVDKNRNAYLDKPSIESLIKKYLGVKDVHWLERIVLTGDDTDGHIDTLVRFVDDHTLIYTGRNSDHHDARVLEDLHKQIDELCFKNRWRAIELPSPIVVSKEHGGFLPATYANYLNVNSVIYLPIYQVVEDLDAIEIFRRAFPAHDIVPINCAALLEQNGSLHCATMQLHHPVSFNSATLKAASSVPRKF